MDSGPNHAASLPDDRLPPKYQVGNPPQSHNDSSRYASEQPGNVEGQTYHNWRPIRDSNRGRESGGRTFGQWDEAGTQSAAQALLRLAHRTMEPDDQWNCGDDLETGIANVVDGQCSGQEFGQDGGHGRLRRRLSVASVDSTIQAAIDEVEQQLAALRRSQRAETVEHSRVQSP